MSSRRCLICSNINPCPTHSEREQEAELCRNMREIKRIEAEARTTEPKQGGE